MTWKANPAITSMRFAASRTFFFALVKVIKITGSSTPEQLNRPEKKRFTRRAVFGPFEVPGGLSSYEELPVNEVISRE